MTVNIVNCAHECICDCQIHYPGVLHAPVHNHPCCNYKCSICFIRVKAGREVDHMLVCHNKTKTEAEAILPR